MSQNQHAEIVVQLHQEGPGSSEGPLNALLNSSYSMRSAAEGLAHVSNLLSILAHASEATATCFDATTAFQNYLSWLMDSFLVVHDIRKRWAANLTLHECCMKTGELFLSSINSLLSSLRHFIWPFVLRKGYMVLSTICAAMLEDPNQLSDQSQITLCSALLNLTAVCKEFGSMRQVLALNLLATLPSGEDAHSNLGSDFKVGRRCDLERKLLTVLQVASTTLRQACGDNAPLQKNGIDSATFESPNLLAEFQSLGLHEVKSKSSKSKIDLKAQVEDGPPTKRRKINDDVNVFREITADLYELLGAQRATDLEGLHQLAE